MATETQPSPVQDGTTEPLLHLDTEPEQSHSSDTTPNPNPLPVPNTTLNTNPTTNTDNPQPNPNPNPDPQNPDPDLTSTSLIKYSIALSLFTALLPLHIWGAYNFSFRALLYGYLFAVVGAFYGIAAIVLLLGVMVPPIMLVHWVWEVWSEDVPVDEGAPPVEVAEQRAVQNEGGGEEEEWVDEEVLEERGGEEEMVDGVEVR
ncbi:MAG: hypothetical protein Q9162_000040 [Coniocarpon cinnabarinum]